MNKIKIERDIKLTHDCAGEFTLPDYLPAVGKLLMAECSVIPDEEYIRESSSSGLTAELGGSVTFRVVWAADGGEGEERGGKPAAAVFKCDYETAAVLGSIPVPNCRVTTTPEGVFCRVTGPRKLSLRARLSSRVLAMTDADLPMPEACSADGIETLHEKTEAAAVISGSVRDLFATADLPSDGEMLFCRGEVNVTSCALSSPTECRVEGDLILTCRSCREGAVMPSVLTVPFAETVPLDTSIGIDTDTVVGCRAYGTVTSEETRGEGDGSVIELMYDLFAEVLLCREDEIIRDAYSCRGESACTYETLEYLAPVGMVSGNLSVNERTEAPGRGRLELLTGAASVEGVSSERGRLRVTGELTGTALFTRDGEYESVPFSVPWKYEASLPSGVSIDDNDKLSYWGDAKVLTLTGRADGDLSVTAELLISATVTETRHVTAVSELILSSGASAGRGGISVYYPMAGESVWDVAKRFRVPTAKVAVPENVDEGGKPRRVVVI